MSVGDGMGQSAGLLVTSALRRSALLRHGLGWTGRRTLSGNTEMEAEEDQASTKDLTTVYLHLLVMLYWTRTRVFLSVRPPTKFYVSLAQ